RPTICCSSPSVCCSSAGSTPEKAGSACCSVPAWRGSGGIGNCPSSKLFPLITRAAMPTPYPSVAWSSRQLLPGPGKRRRGEQLMMLAHRSRHHRASDGGDDGGDQGRRGRGKIGLSGAGVLDGGARGG